MATPATFVHLHVHTEYSLVDGVVRIKSLIKQCADAGMPALAVTDLSNMFAMVKFYRAAWSAGIKPVIGAECLIRDEAQSGKPFRMVFLCQNTQGYRNLAELISRGYVEGQIRGVPVLRKTWISTHTEGIIALSAGREGDIGCALLNGNVDEARQYLHFWKALFPDRFYLEVIRTGRPDEERYLQECIGLAVATMTPVVATNDVCFRTANDFEVHEARVCIGEGRALDDPRRRKNYSGEQYLRTAEEMIELFSDFPEAVENSVAIARRCNLELMLDKNFLPGFPIPAGLSAEKYLIQQSKAGLQKRLDFLRDARLLHHQAQVYDERLQAELDVIIDMGFPGYFLIVADFIQWSRDNGVPVGPGRGSGAGSLVAYVLGITDIDPISHELLFERFLNPERISMPDFDIDFCMDGRDRVIEYVAKRYGSDKVSQIITYGTMAARGVVRDVARVLGYPYGVGDKIARLIPFEIGMTLDKALQEEPEFRRLYDEDEEVHSVVELARPLEGLTRNVSKHAGGVVIAPSALTDFTPLYCEEGGSLVTQLDKDDIEAIGLVKFDFLGLRTLTIIDWTIKNIAKLTGQKIDIRRIDNEDCEVFRLLRDCSTTAIFQLESSGMKDLIMRLQPDCFADIVALMALFRPGPLQSGMVDDFINRKHGRAVVEYPHPQLEPILKPTYGVILYQEQVMQIARVLAGYTLGGADMLRRAMGKKKPEEMAAHRTTFIEGALNNDIPERQAAYIFDLMEKFAGYGFNKSHSVAYALLSYQTAWLKARHPSAFMAAVLSSDMDNTDKILGLVNECRETELEICPPNINQSDYKFIASDNNSIIYGLGAIKGVGRGVIADIVGQRNVNGPYKDLTDLCMRCDKRRLHRGVLQAIIQAGATDCLDKNRAALLDSLDAILRLADQHGHNTETGQTDLFGLTPEPAVSQPESTTTANIPVWQEEQRLSAEKEVLGLYLTGHPIGHYEEDVNQITTHRLRDIDRLAATEMPDRGGSHHSKHRKNGIGVARVAGLISRIQFRKTRRGRMASILLDDRTGRLEIALFSETLEKFGQYLGRDNLIVIEGDLGFHNFGGGEARLTARTIWMLDQARAHYAKYLMITMESDSANPDLMRSLQETLKPYRPGRCPVRLYYANNSASTAIHLGDDWRLAPAEDLLNSLVGLDGVGTAKLIY